MADEPTNKGLTSEQAESNRLAAQGNEYGKQEVDVANKSFALQRAGLGQIANRMREINSEVQETKQTLADKFTEGYKNTLEGLTKNAQVFGNTGNALKEDFGKLQLAFAPLTSIPGIATAAALIKGILAKTLLFLISSEKQQMVRDKFNRLNERRKQLNKGVRVNKLMEDKDGPGAGKARNLFLLGLAGVTLAFKGFLAGLLKSIGQWTRLITFGKFGKMFETGAAKLVKSSALTIKKFTDRFKTFAKKLVLFKDASKTFTAIGKTLGGVLRMITRFAAGIGRLFFPIQVIMTVIDGVKGAMAGFDKYKDSSFVGGLFAGLAQGITDMIAFIVGFPLDLLYSTFKFIAGLFGAKMKPEYDVSIQELISDLGSMVIDAIAFAINKAKDFITNFDYSGMVSKMGTGLMNIFRAISNFPMAVGKAAMAALTSPFSAFKTFKETFAEQMATPTTRETMAANVASSGVEEQSEATSDAVTNTGVVGGGTNTAVVNTTVNNTAGKKVYTQRQNRPADDYAYRLAVAQ